MTIEELFAILKDEKWHSLTDLSDQIEAQTDILTEFLKFLSKRGIVAYEDKLTESKSDPNGKTFCQTKLNPCPHIVTPPGKTDEVKSILICNISKTSQQSRYESKTKYRNQPKRLKVVGKGKFIRFLKYR